MSIDFMTLGAAMKNTEESLSGNGVIKGEPGEKGTDGKSAYQIWLDEGNVGTEQDFLASLKGADGTMTFEDLTEEQKESLKGEQGQDGKSTYQLWLDLGNDGTEEDFLESLKGENGPIGESGSDGRSAYEIWIDEGNSGTEQDFLDSLKGEKGADGTMTFADLTEEQKESLKGEPGADGTDGKSAYNIWLDVGNTGSEEDFLDSLRGEPGDMGESGSDGASAYEIWIDEGNSGTEQDFLYSLKGEPGEKGEDGSKNIDDDNVSTDTTWSSEKIASELGEKTYTSLAELGLTAPVTVGDIFNAMPDKTMAVIACEDIAVHITDVPTSFGVLTIKKSEVGRFSIDYQTSLASSPCNVKKWIGTLKGDDGTGLYWKEVAYKDNIAIYKSLSELELDTTATLKDITRAMAKNSMVAIKVDAMADQSEYNSITQGTVTIYKIEDARIQAIMTEKSTGRTWIGILGGENTIIGWKELRSDSPFYRIVTQGVAGYFKFKPTSNGIDQSLRISVTDNYGGMINISGAKPTASQYKPFKCIRLSNGEYTNYDAMKLANNKMLKLFYYDGYFYLKVTTYTTCTFIGLIEAPAYVEIFNETDAEEIPIRSVFDTPYNDGYADPSIIAIGDADSADGVIKSLDTLGFTGDVMTWYTGVYRISHVGGLTNLPAEVTEEKPGFRLEHHDVKKWGSNHNPYASTYGCRQSIFHYKGNVFVRYTESGDTAGTLITDTGWQKLSKTVIIDKLADLGLTAPCTTAEVANALKRIKPQNNVAIAIIDCAPGQVSDVPSDYGLLHIETVGYDRISIRFDGVGSSNYKGSWIGKITGSAGTFSGITWDKPATESNTLGGKEVKVLEIDLSSSDYKPSSTSGTTTMPIKGLANKAKVIRVEGYYIEADGDVHAVTLNTNYPGNIACSSAGIWQIAMTASSAGQGSGFAKIYYVD